MARTREFDDATVVRAARNVFWERGYASTSLSQLQAATGLSRSSLYETYDSKRALFDRAMQSYLDDVADPLLTPVEAAGAGKDELAAYFRIQAEFLRSASLPVARRGCLMLNTSMELHDLDEPAATAVRNYRRRIRAALFNAISTISSRSHPETLADTLTATLIGLTVIARVDPPEAAAIAESVAAEIELW